MSDSVNEFLHSRGWRETELIKDGANGWRVRAVAEETVATHHSSEEDSSHILPTSLPPIWCKQMWEGVIHPRHTWGNEVFVSAQCPGMYDSKECSRIDKHMGHYWEDTGRLVREMQTVWCDGLHRPKAMRTAHCGNNDVHDEHRIAYNAVCLGVDASGKGLLVQHHEGRDRLVPWPTYPENFKMGVLIRFRTLDWKPEPKPEKREEVAMLLDLPEDFDDAYWDKMRQVVKEAIREVLAERWGSL